MKSSAVTENFATLDYLKDDSTKLWQICLGHEFFASFGKGLLEGLTNYKFEFGECCVLDKKTNVKFGTAIHCMRGLLYCVHIDVLGPTKTASLGGHRYFVFFVDDYSRHCSVYHMRQEFKVLALFVK